jgi:hypothetical protein
MGRNHARKECGTPLGDLPIRSCGDFGTMSQVMALRSRQDHNIADPFATMGNWAIPKSCPQIIIGNSLARILLGEQRW